MKNEIVLYRPDALAEHIEVRIDEETVWLNRQQISDLFNRDVKTIGKHITMFLLKANSMKKQLSQNLRQFKTKGVEWLRDN
jgi:hypothetical protein